MTHILIPITAIFLTMFDTQLQSIPLAPSFFNVKMEFGLIKPYCSPPAALAISSFHGCNGNRKGSSGHGNKAIASNQGYEYWPHKYGNIVTRTGRLLHQKTNSRLNTTPLQLLIKLCNWEWISDRSRLNA